jgi:perosamine synthetase
LIRLAVPSIDEEDLAAVRETLATGFLVQGRVVAEFERVIGEYVGVEHTVAVANCTAALHLSLLALGVGPGDEVAVSTLSWPASANVIVLCGAKPVFVDMEATTYNMDPAALEQALAARPKIKVVLVVDAFGNMADLAAISAACDRHGVQLLEDAACSLGARVAGRNAGQWGAAGCFSFHPRKTITTGEGGAVTTKDEAFARQIRILRNHGLDPDAASPDFVAA